MNGIDKIHLRWLKITKLLPTNPHVAIGPDYVPPFEIIEILQYQNGYGNWIDVPTVEEKDEVQYWANVFAGQSITQLEMGKDIYMGNHITSSQVRFSDRQIKMILEIIDTELKLREKNWKINER